MAIREEELKTAALLERVLFKVIGKRQIDVKDFIDKNLTSIRRSFLLGRSNRSNKMSCGRID